MKKLIFVTSKFPFGSGETFIENEIKYLASAFDKIYIFATEATDNETIRAVPNNIHVFPAKPKPITKKDYIPSLFKPLNIKEILSNCLGRHMFNKVSAVCYLSACVNSSSSHISDFLKMCDVTPEDEVTIYSYWLSTVGMCALNIKKRLEKCGKKPKCVSRCHGFDVYADRTETNYLPSQKYQIENFDEIYPCSKSGENYLKERYPSQKNKISAKCPLCGGEIKDDKFGWKCQSCGEFNLNYVIAGKQLSTKELEDIIFNGKTDVLKGFTSKAGKKLDARLVFDESTKRINFSFDKS